MSDDLFSEYKGIRDRDGVVAAAVVRRTDIMKLSQITGGTAVSKKIRGGSIMMSELILHGVSAKPGDYIVADHLAFFVAKKDFFEAKYKPKGPLRDPSSERR